MWPKLAKSTRQGKLFPSTNHKPARLTYLKAAMAESMGHVPDEKILNAYKEWSEGGWGMILTGIRAPLLDNIFHD